ncbi:MAG: Sec-dependent nitrous-oxide reductase [Bacteroidetes bacterium]|nr:MAG: Sec-dependent nitrous-oxide reductase [Bacteroidota bacterium]
MKKVLFFAGAMLLIVVALYQCKTKGAATATTSDAAEKAYVAPGTHDEFYNFVSGGFNGNVSVYGLPSGRLLKIIPTFTVFPENGYGFSEETKAMLTTSHGWIPWDDQHHMSVSETDGIQDGRWLFANANNTPRVARIDLTTFKTVEILEVPNSGGNHSSPFITENTEYVVAGTRFSVPLDGKPDVPIDSYKENFNGTLSFISVDPGNGHMKIAFQVLMPGMAFDLARGGRGPSKDWMFFSCYNSEQANTLLEVNASQNDKDFIIAVNWKKAEEYVKAGQGKRMTTRYAHNMLNEETHTASTSWENEVLLLDPTELADFVYLMPCPKSPHGCDVDPTGKYIAASGKLAAVIPVFSFDNMLKAIADKNYDGEYNGIPVLKYDAVLHGEVQKPGLGPLHTEFDANGNAYTSMFVSSEIVKWNVESLEVLDRVPTYYSIGHLCVPGGDTKKPWGKYVIAYNKITKDRFLPTGPELTQSAQLYDISGDKMKLILDFPTIGEPHYANAVPADLIKDKSVKIYKLEDNKHPYVAKGEGEAKVERRGNEVHVYMTAIRSHLTPDNIEGVKVGDDVYFHVTNLEQDWDIPHGFTIKGSKTTEILVMPGETQTLYWKAEKAGVIPFYCTDFCSALHQEMQGYVRVSPTGSNVPLKFGTGVEPVQ